jgi:hypothetical protein
MSATHKYEITIVKPSPFKFKFMKALRMVGKLELRQASALTAFFEKTSGVLATGIDYDVAQYIADTLRNAGAEVEVNESNFVFPMLCFPDVNKKYTKSFFWESIRESKV